MKLAKKGGAKTMENVIIVLIIVIVCIFGVKSYAKRLTQGCCRAGGDSEKKIRVRDKNKDHYPYCVKIYVEGMTCSRCKERVENAFNREEGVWAVVNLKENSAMIRMKKELSEAELRRIVQRAGYAVTGMEGGAAV